MYVSARVLLTSEDNSVEKRETSLKKMLATVMKDKEKIEETIAELDRYKREALESTWKKVDGYASPQTSAFAANPVAGTLGASLLSFCLGISPSCNRLTTRI
jgi:hypothetical protein